MPLIEAREGETMLVIRVAAEPKVRKHLENLGIMTGALLTPLSHSDGNMIVRVHDSRIAINRELAQSIHVGRRPSFA
ncbi:MAG: ferrous iron transport protein A [Clostridiales bacterium]|nr:ferrous iron transport protein A [Clostridiales bacterium]